MIVFNLTDKDRVKVTNLIEHSHIDYKVLGYGSDYPAFPTIDEAYDFFLKNQTGDSPFPELYVWLGSGKDLPNRSWDGSDAVHYPIVFDYEHREAHKERCPKNILQVLKIHCTDLYQLYTEEGRGVVGWKPIYTRHNNFPKKCVVILRESEISLSAEEESEMLNFLSQFSNPNEDEIPQNPVNEDDEVFGISKPFVDPRKVPLCQSTKQFGEEFEFNDSRPTFVY